MLLAHPAVMTRWLRPVWEDETLWRMLCANAPMPSTLLLLPTARATKRADSTRLTDPVSLVGLEASSPSALPWESFPSKGLKETAIFWHPLPQGGWTAVHEGVGVMALGLIHHDKPFDQLADMAGKARSLCLIDWAIPERNLDYLCHMIPWALAFSSGAKTRKKFRAFMRSGVEGLVERFHARQQKVVLRRKGHKKYRGGSLIAVCYEVKRP